MDLFAGAGGLSEGFIRAGFEPVAHVEMDEAACYTLKTRMAYHWLKSQKKLSSYRKYLKGIISRTEFYSIIPRSVLDTVIHSEIGPDSIDSVFSKADDLLGNRKLDILIGGPPCQAYSIAGRARDKNKMQGDKRNYLFLYYSYFLKRYLPKYFIFENVTGLLSAKDIEGNLYLDEMKRVFTEIGYKVQHKTLIASDYGVPQDRKRVILVGYRGKENKFYPAPKLTSPDCTINHLFEDLPKLNAGEKHTENEPQNHSRNARYLKKTGIKTNNAPMPLTMHIARPYKDKDLEIYRRIVTAWNKTSTRPKYDHLPERLKTHNNRNSFIDRFKVVAGDKPASHTVVAHIFKDGHYYIHPDIEQNRSLTPREAARLQTFPDDYFFESISEKPGRTAAYKQIGNAVPVLLAEKIAKALASQWK